MAIIREGEDRLTPDQFCYWFQGFAEIHGGVPTPEQWDIIKHHLELVFRPVVKSSKKDAALRPLTEVEERDFIKSLSEMKTDAAHTAVLTRQDRIRPIRLC